LAASRDGREVRSTVRAPCSAAISIARSFRAAPTPFPRAASSTTTSSIHARRPVGIRNTTSVSEPSTVPSSTASSSVLAGEVTISVSSSAVGGGDERDSWGSSRAKSSTSAGVTSLQISIATMVGQ